MKRTARLIAQLRHWALVDSKSTDPSGLILEAADTLEELMPKCETCGGTGIEETYGGHGDKKEIQCRECRDDNSQFGVGS